MSARVRALAVALAVAGLVLAWLWPVPRELGRVLIGAGFRFDQYVSTYVLANNARALLADPARMFDATFCYPGLETLTSTEHFAGFAPLFAPFRLLFPEPLAAYDAFVLAMFVANGMAMAITVLRWTDDGWAALTAGVLYACAPLRLAGAQWLQTTGTILFPLLPLALEGVLLGRPLPAAVLLAVVVALQVVMSVNLSVYAAVLGGVFVVALLLAAPRPRPWRRLPWLVAAALPALPGGWSIVRLYLRESPYGAQGLDLGHALFRQGASVFLLDPLADGADLWRRLLRALGVARAGTAGSIGPFAVDAGRVPLVVGALGAWLGWHGDPRQRARVLALVAVLVVTVLAALGPGAVQVGGVAIPLPSAWLAALPVAGGLRTPERHLFAAAVALGILTGIALARLWHGWPWVARAGATALVLGLAALDTPPMVREPVPPVVAAPAHEILRARADGSPVLEWPALAPSEVAARWLAESALHWQRTTLCFTSVYTPAWLYFGEKAGRTQDAAGFATLAAQVGAGWILVHRGQAPFDPAWAAAAGAELVHEDATHLLYRRPGGTDRRAAWNGVASSLAGTDRSPIPDGERVAVVAADVPATLGPHESRWIEVQLRNTGPRAWPGDAPPGTGVVDLVTDWRTSDGRPVDGLTDPVRQARRAAWPRPWRQALESAQVVPERAHPLWRDVAPGDRLAFRIPLTAPPAPGSYLLRLVLEQVGTGPFRLHDGSAALVVPVTVIAAAQGAGGASR